jgi:hypothetical protein
MVYGDAGEPAGPPPSMQRNLPSGMMSPVRVFDSFHGAVTMASSESPIVGVEPLTLPAITTANCMTINLHGATRLTLHRAVRRLPFQMPHTY